VDDAARKRPLVYDRSGDLHYDFTSAFIKSMRGSDPRRGRSTTSRPCSRRERIPASSQGAMVILASEDVGDADPQALLVAVAAAHALEHVGLPEARLNLAQAAIYLARAPKSNAVIRALSDATRDVRERGNLRPPKIAPRLPLPGRKEARPRRGVRLPALRSRRLRGRLPARRAEGSQVLQAEGMTGFQGSGEAYDRFMVAIRRRSRWRLRTWPGSRRAGGCSTSGAAREP